MLTPHKGKDGYLFVILRKNNKSKNIKIHQLVAMAFLNHVRCGYKLVVNHKNRNRLDNRVVNLEIITARENTNQKHMKSSSKYTGVCRVKNSNRWVSQIIINGKNKYLGTFEDELEASEAYQKELIKLLP